MTRTPMLEISETGRKALKEPETLLEPLDLARAVYYLAVNEKMKGQFIYTRLGADGPTYDLVLPNVFQSVAEVTGF